MLMKVAFTLYPITDTPRARAFYESTLGLAVGKHAAGVPFKAKLIHSPVCRMSVILDPDGNSILLHQLKR
jgi:catechol 2,3-dioxygenase-like lactoylglutathione lyase family enzyme